MTEPKTQPKTQTAPSPQPIILTKDELHDITKQAASEAVEETLTKLGIDHSEPFEMQRDFQFVRDWRNASESAKAKAIVVAVGVLFSGVLGALWVGLKTIFTAKGGTN